MKYSNFILLSQKPTPSVPNSKITYHKVDKVVSGVTVVDELIVDDDEVLDGALLVVREQDVVRPEVAVRQSVQGTRWGVLGNGND